MVEVSFKQPCGHSIDCLLRNLDVADLNELLIQGVDPEWAIRYSVDNAEESVAIYGDGILACITGITVNDGLAPSATPWLLGTPFMQQHPRKVLKYSKMLLARWSARHPYMFNHVDARHTRAIAWLSHLGLRKTLVPEYGPYAKPFYLFEHGENPCALAH